MTAGDDVPGKYNDHALFFLLVFPVITPLIVPCDLPYLRARAACVAPLFHASIISRRCSSDNAVLSL